MKTEYLASKSAKTNKHLEDVPCNICGSEKFDVLFPELPGMADANPRDVFSSSSHEISKEQIVKCKKCGLVYTTPRFKSESIVDGYSVGEDNDYTSQEKGRIETFKKNLKVLNQYLPEKGKLLDVGAAAGYFVKVAKDDGWKAEGIEPSKWMSKYASEKLNIKVRPGTIHDYKYNKGTFDAITYWDVLEHVPNPMKDLKRANALLRKNGVLIVNYPDWDSIPARIFKRSWWFVLSIHLFYFTPDTVTNLLKKAGFKVIKIKPHYQSLELGYLVYRLEQYSKPLAGLIGGVVKALGMSKFNLPYYAGQTMVIARKRK